jgi:hypothetical protein
MKTWIEFETDKDHDPDELCDLVDEAIENHLNDGLHRQIICTRVVKSFKKVK